jgi:hypothetical protein
MVFMVIGVLPGPKGRIGHPDHTHFIGQTPPHGWLIAGRWETLGAPTTAAQQQRADDHEPETHYTGNAARVQRLRFGVRKRKATGTTTLCQASPGRAR